MLARNGLTVWGTAITGGRRDVARNRINDISGDPVIDGGTVYASNQSGPHRPDRHARPASGSGRSPEGSYGPAWPVGGVGLPAVGHRLAGARRRRHRARSSGRCSCRSYFPNRGFFGRGKPFKAVAYYGPMLAGGRLWVAGADGLLRAFSPVDGAALAQVPLPGGAAAAPAVAGGVMYIATRDGRLLAFQ